MLDVKITNSSFKLIFFLRSYVCWNYILVASLDGEREKVGGRGKEGEQIDAWTLSRLCQR